MANVQTGPKFTGVQTGPKFTVPLECVLCLASGQDYPATQN